MGIFEVIKGKSCNCLVWWCSRQWCYELPSIMHGDATIFVAFVCGCWGRTEIWAPARPWVPAFPWIGSMGISTARGISYRPLSVGRQRDLFCVAKEGGGGVSGGRLVEREELRLNNNNNWTAKENVMKGTSVIWLICGSGCSLKLIKRKNKRRRKEHDCWRRQTGPASKIL